MKKKGNPGENRGANEKFRSMTDFTVSTAEIQIRRSHPQQGAVLAPSSPRSLNGIAIHWNSSRMRPNGS